MSGTRPIFVNAYEEKADALLQEVSLQFGDRLQAKIRVADAIDTDGGALTTSEFHYGQRAHFDFVLVDSETSHPKLAIEIDGTQHSTDGKQQWRDRTKDRLAELAGLPLIRVNSDFAFREGRYVLLQYLCEIFYRAEAFGAAQEAGHIPFDEPFMHFSFLELRDDGQFQFGSLDADARSRLMQLHKEGTLPHFAPDSWTGATDNQGNVRADVYLRANEKQVLVGTATVRNFGNVGISAGELAEELAVVNLQRDTVLWLAGEPLGHNFKDFRTRFRAFVRDHRPFMGGHVGLPGRASEWGVPYPPFHTDGIHEIVFETPPSED